MKKVIPVLDLESKKIREKELPEQFNEEYRPDLIKRAVLALQAERRQPYGASPVAGNRHSAELSRRRRKYRGAYGYGISRITRKILTRRGTRFYWVGALAPNTRGGRRAHPPKAEKSWKQKINKKEKRKSICSALTAVLDKALVQQRGHKVPLNYPFLVCADFEKLAKTKEVKKVLEKLNFQEELQRCLVKKIRSGLGKLRGRRYHRKKGLLIVVGEDCPLLKGARNLPGVDVVKPEQLNTELLAPGAQPGRITLFTEKALEKIKEKRLFL